MLVKLQLMTKLSKFYWPTMESSMGPYFTVYVQLWQVSTRRSWGAPLT